MWRLAPRCLAALLQPPDGRGVTGDGGTLDYLRSGGIVLAYGVCAAGALPKGGGAEMTPNDELRAIITGAQIQEPDIAELLASQSTRSATRAARFKTGLLIATRCRRRCWSC